MAKTAKDKEKKGEKVEEQQEVKPWSFRFKWEGRTHEITIESLTYGERAELEEYMSLAWPLVLASAWASSAKLMIYLAYLAVRRSDDDVNLKDFEALTDDDIVMDGEGDDDRPTQDGDETSGRSNSSSGTDSSPGSSKASRQGS